MNHLILKFLLIIFSFSGLLRINSSPLISSKVVMDGGLPVRFITMEYFVGELIEYFVTKFMIKKMKTPVSVKHLIALLIFQCFQIPLTSRMFPI